MSIKINNISYKIDEKYILNNLNLEIFPGKILTVLGPNGAGKSSLIRLIAGDTNPTNGQIIYNNNDLKTLSLEARSKIRAVMSQSQLISFDYNVQEIIEMGWVERGINNISSDFKKSVFEVARKCNIEKLLQRKFNTLSGGEQKRAHLARTLLQLWSPLETKTNRYLILDEPLNNLDLFQKVNTMNIIKEMSKKKKFGIILIIHDLNLAAKYSDYLAVLLEGKLKFYGKPKEVLTTKRILKIYRLKMKVSSNPLQINYT